MMEDPWAEIRSRYSTSIIQLAVVQSQTNPIRPYLGPMDSRSSGSSWLIDGKKGILVTNAHVVQDSSAIWGMNPKLGKKRMNVKLLSIVRDKDLALCQIEKDDLKELMKDEDPDRITLKLGDSLFLNGAEPVMAVGYPLGSLSLKFTSGVVSGMFTDETSFSFSNSEDSYNRDPVYVSVTAPLNAGISGGPLINKDGKVIAIATAGMPHLQAVGLGIPIHVLMANLPGMMKDLEPRIPTMAIKWNGVNDDTIKFLTGSSKEKGIFVRRTMPDSVFKDLERGDILHSFSFNIYPPDEYSKFKLDDLNKNKNKGTEILAVLDELGDINLCRKSKNACVPILNKKYNMSEVADLIPIDSPLKINFTRNGKKREIKTKYNHVDSGRVKGVYSSLEPYDWEIIGGAIVTPLLLNQMSMSSKYQNLDDEEEDIFYEDNIIIIQVDQETELGKTGAILPGDILTHVNGIPVKTLNDIRKAKNKYVNNHLILETKKGAFITFNKKTHLKDEKRVKETII